VLRCCLLFDVFRVFLGILETLVCVRRCLVFLVRCCDCGLRLSGLGICGNLLILVAGVLRCLCLV